MYRMILTEFLVHLGFYNEAFTRTPEYDALLIECLAKESLESCWCYLSITSGYNSLWSLALRYIHHLLGHSLTRREVAPGW